MIEDGLKYIADLGRKASKVEIVEIDGRKYTEGSISEVVDPSPQSLRLSSLSSLVEYVKSQFDKDTHKNNFIIQVHNPEKVTLIGPCKSPWFQRDVLATVDTSNQMDVFSFGHKYAPDDFVLSLQIFFEDKGNRPALLKLAGNVGTERSMTSADDGMTQTVSARKGAVLTESVNVPNPVSLVPFRTFAEVEQPMSPFVFRVFDQGADQLPKMSLSEADGGAWRLVAMKSIKEYFSKHLKDVKVLA